MLVAWLSAGVNNRLRLNAADARALIEWRRIIIVPGMGVN
jgi:hypothetical protein